MPHSFYGAPPKLAPDPIRFVFDEGAGLFSIEGGGARVTLPAEMTESVRAAMYDLAAIASVMGHLSDHLDALFDVEGAPPR